MPNGVNLGAKPGPPRKPTALAILHGDDKKNPKRVNKTEPAIHGDVVMPPGVLTPAAASVWESLAPALIKAQVLKASDVVMFAEFCAAVHALRVSRVRMLQEAEGKVSGRAAGASPMTTYLKLVAVVNQFSAQFGLTPSARAGLSVGEGAGSGNSADLLGA